MARYEHAGKFWTIRRVGAVITTTSGKIGNKGRTFVKHHATEGAAISAHDQLVLDKQREGYRLADASDAPEPAAPSVIDEPVDDERGAALEAAIAADPDDAQAFAVYGDWLQRHGDPRGELIALQHAAAAATGRPGTKTLPAVAVGKHLAEHAKRLLGPLAALVPDIRDPDAPPFVWKHGFIRRAELASAGSRKPRHELVDTLEQLLAHPSGKFLVELAIRADGRKDALAVLDIVKRAAPATLRELDLFARANLDRIGADVWKALPKLERLGITARAFELGELQLPSLRRAKLAATSIASATVEAVAAAPWPVLERLEIRFCAQTGASEADFHDLRPLLLRTDMPRLTHLRLRGCAFAGAVARALVSAPLAQQLEVLDFSFGSFTPQDIATIGAASFPKLRELWMPLGYLDAKTTPVLAKVAKHVIPDSRGPMDTLDFDLAGEIVPRDPNGPDDQDNYDDIQE